MQQPFEPEIRPAVPSEPETALNVSSKKPKPICIADRPYFELLTAMLIVSGAACPKCGFGTRKTSKNWRQCKRCGERIQLFPATPELIKSNVEAIGKVISK